MNHELPADEVRRVLRDADRAQRDALPSWRRALDRAFDPTSGATDDERRGLVGLPPRRAFLTGSAVLAAGAVLAACTTKAPDQIPVSGSAPTVPLNPTTTAPGSPAQNIVLVATGQSIELLAVQTYQTAIDSGLLTTPAILDAVRLFQQQHREHGDLLGATMRTLGQAPVTAPNQYLAENVVDPAVSELTDETSVVQLALALENLAAATYVKATPVLTTPELREAIMSIGGVEARHVAVLHGVLGTTPAPVPFFRTAAAAPTDAYV